MDNNGSSKLRSLLFWDVLFAVVPYWYKEATKDGTKDMQGLYFTPVEGASRAWPPSTPLLRPLQSASLGGDMVLKINPYITKHICSSNMFFMKFFFV